jgi:hypothetical protein
MALVATVNVTFELYLRAGQELLEVPEDALDRHREAIARQEVLEGALVIEAPGQPRLEVADELWAVVANLCFRCVDELSTGDRECWVYTVTNADAHVVVLSMASLLRLLSEHGPVVTVQREPLLQALFACGERFMGLLERLGESQREFAEELRPYAARARAALDA